MQSLQTAIQSSAKPQPTLQETAQAAELLGATWNPDVISAADVSLTDRAFLNVSVSRAAADTFG